MISNHFSLESVFFTKTKSRIKRPQVMSIVKFCPAALDFGYDFVLLVHFLVLVPVLVLVLVLVLVMVMVQVLVLVLVHISSWHTGTPYV